MRGPPSLFPHGHTLSRRQLLESTRLGLSRDFTFCRLLTTATGEEVAIDIVSYAAGHASQPKLNDQGSVPNINSCNIKLHRNLAALAVRFVRAASLSAIQLQDRFESTFEDFVLHTVFLVFAATKLAFYLYVGAFLQGCREIGQLAERNAAVPFGVGFRRAFGVLPRALRGHRQCGEG